jgi:hypothetical protein
MDVLPVLPLLNSNMQMTTALPSRVRWLLALVFVLHALLGANLGLSVDEAHYALYAAHPALSYFDHPPLVGWAQWPLVALGAPTALLRLVPGLLWLGTMLLVYRVTLRIAVALKSGNLQATTAGAEQSAFWAVAVLLLAPLLHILGIGLLPDTLLMFWSVALMLQTLRLMERAQADSLLQWMLLGGLLGLAGLSKYTAIFTAVAVALCLFSAHGLAVLRRPGLWFAVVLALLLVSPVAIWNAQNHWVSFVYQAKHGAGSSWQALHLLRFLLVQVLAFGPLLWWGALGVSAVTKEVRMVLGFFVVPFAVLAYLSGGGSSLPHWTAPAWVALAPFAGIGLARSWASGARFKVQALVPLLVLLQALACVALPAIMLSAGMPFMEGKTASLESSDAPNPFADLHGWDAAGARAQALAAQQGLDAVSVQNWTLASRIGWYARPLKVHVLEDRFDQFDLWAGKLAVGGSALLVDWSQLPYEMPIGTHGFTQCSKLDHLEVQRFGYAVSSFDFYACNGWSGQPSPRIKSAVTKDVSPATAPTGPTQN